MRRTILLLLVTALAALWLTASGAEQCTPKRRALLVGINEYAEPTLPDLRGAVNDVELLKRILVTRFGFADEDVSLLTNERATRTGLLAALDQFVARACPADVVYFHYSGHGSQIADMNGDEEDGMDETILPHDARTPGIADILDDELDRRFARLTAGDVLIVFDSCHSGTVTRSANVVRPRAVPPDSRLELYRSLNTATRGVVPVESLPHVLMTSAPANEEALDGPLDEGFYGLFSFSLARSLNDQGPTATPEQILAGAKRELQRIQEQLYTRPPEPQLEGPPDRLRRPILSAAGAGTAVPPNGAARRAWLEVQPISDRDVRLVNGTTLNARAGSWWAIYPPGEQQFDYGSAQAVGRVTQIAGDDALLALTTVAGSIEAGARAIAVAPPDASGRQPVALTGVPVHRREAIMRLIQATVPSVEPASPGDFARVHVNFDGSSWEVLDASGLQLISGFSDLPDEQVAMRLATILSWSSRATSLLSLDNPASDIQLSVAVRTAGSSSSRGAGARGLVRVTDDFAPTYRVRSGNEPRTPVNSLVLEIRADRDVYITVASVDTEGQIQLLFPNDYQRAGFYPDGRLPADTTMSIPDSLQAGNRAGFYWDFSPPTGKDTIRVFAAEDLATAAEIRAHILRSQASSDALPQLGSKLVASTVRGIRLIADTSEADPDAAPTAGTIPGQWTASSVSLLITD